jgi:hypothetical protein
VLSWSRATRDLLKSFGWGIRALHRLATATMVPSPRRPPHSISPSHPLVEQSRPAIATKPGTARGKDFGSARSPLLSSRSTARRGLSPEIDCPLSASANSHAGGSEFSVQVPDIRNAKSESFTVPVLSTAGFNHPLLALSTICRCPRQSKERSWPRNRRNLADVG